MNGKGTARESCFLFHSSHISEIPNLKYLDKGANSTFQEHYTLRR